MNKNFRKAIVAVAALLAVATVPVVSHDSTQALGGYGDWPFSRIISNR